MTVSQSRRVRSMPEILGAFFLCFAQIYSPNRRLPFRILFALGDETASGVVATESAAVFFCHATTLDAI